LIHGAWTSPRRLAVVFATIAGITVAAFLGVRVFTGPTEYEPYPKFLRRDINGRGIPLTAEQKVRAVEIALGDARVKALVGERRVVEAVAGEWFVHGFLVGAEVRIAFEGPQVIEGERSRSAPKDIPPIVKGRSIGLDTGDYAPPRARR